MLMNAKVPAPDRPADVIAAQFAGGKSIAELAAAWDVDAALVEAMVRVQMRMMIPRWAGGLKPTRDEMRKQRRLRKLGDAAPRLIEDLND